MQVVILAGGLGTRLRPLTLTVPKSMVPIHGRPFLEYQIEWVKRFGFNRVLLLTGYLGEQIEAYFQDGSRWGVSISYSRESSPMGTAGALKLARSKLDEEFLLLNGDTYLPIDYCAMYQFFRTGEQLGVMAVYENTEGLAPNNVALGDDGMITLYARHGEPSLTHLAAGAYVLKRKVIGYVPPARTYSIEDDLSPVLAEARQMKGYVIAERFYDMGSAERLWEARQALASTDVADSCSQGPPPSKDQARCRRY
jgi:NDP-sugar pyrophosphorylase family protein